MFEEKGNTRFGFQSEGRQEMQPRQPVKRLFAGLVGLPPASVSTLPLRKSVGSLE
jgi:hypothetical protein